MFGWKKDKYSNKDYLHRTHKPRLANIPDLYLLGNIPSVRDQGNVGSCVGFAIGYNLTREALAKNIYSEAFSPTWIYNGARFIEGTLKEDSGAYPRDALDWILNKGGLLEHFWPYNTIQFDPTPPPSKFDEEAAKYPVFAYYRITGGIDAICEVIASGNCVCLGIPWYSAWMNPSSNGVLKDVSWWSSVAGGHEVLIYGYDRGTKFFKGLNSWGIAWGAGGTFSLPFEAFDCFGRYGGYDAHYIEVIWEESEPEPEPEPPKGTKFRISKSVDGSDWEIITEFDV